MEISDIIKRASESAFGQPLINNVLRSIISEAIVDAALGDGWIWCSADWASCDFKHADGTRLEVKQSAALQTWHGPDARPSRSSFDIAARQGYFEGADWVPNAGRNADIYVFAHHPLTDATADHRNPSQWRFYVVRAAHLRVAKTISLAALRRLSDAVGVDDMNQEVERLRRGSRFVWRQGDVDLANQSRTTSSKC